MNNTQNINSAIERQVLISLSIPAEEYIRVYQGSAKKVSTIDSEGRRISFPVNILQPFVTRDGVAGSFAIYFDQANKFIRIVRLA
jgi:hypothetical protein